MIEVSAATKAPMMLIKRVIKSYQFIYTPPHLQLAPVANVPIKIKIEANILIFLSILS